MKYNPHLLRQVGVVDLRYLSVTVYQDSQYFVLIYFYIHLYGRGAIFEVVPRPVIYRKNDINRR